MYLVHTVNRGMEKYMDGSQNLLTFTESNFDDEVLSSEIPVLVDFTATWCGPCKRLTPILAALADELVGKVKVGKIDTDSSPAVSLRYGIRAMPTVIVFMNGQPAAQHVGLANRETLLTLLENN